MTHRCTRCQRSYKRRANVGGVLVCPYCGHPQTKIAQVIEKINNGPVDYKLRATGEHKE